MCVCGGAWRCALTRVRMHRVRGLVGVGGRVTCNDVGDEDDEGGEVPAPSEAANVLQTELTLSVETPPGCWSPTASYPPWRS